MLGICRDACADVRSFEYVVTGKGHCILIWYERYYVGAEESTAVEARWRKSQRAMENELYII